MERVATTFRLDPAVKEGLIKLSKLERRTLNQLANEAIAEFVDRRIREAENELQSTLEDLRAYRTRDSDFERAIEAVIEVEATTEEDPAEGKLVSEAGSTGEQPEMTDRDADVRNFSITPYTS